MMRRVSRALIIGLIAFGVIYILSFHTRLLTGIERHILDGNFYLREPGVGEQNPFVSDRALLLGYDVDSIGIIGKWPWKRYVHARFLNNIEQFSPQTVFFDIIFAKPDEVPEYIRERLQLDDEFIRKVEAAFSGMDLEFARALGKYDNVFIDLQLIEQPRTHLPEDFQDRIRLNEERLFANYSLPVTDVVSPLVFQSLEPVLTEYATAARALVINVPTGEDGVIRMFPLFYTYRSQGGEQRNVLTVATAMLLEYYHIGPDAVELQPDRVIFRDAKVPKLDPASRKTLSYSMETEALIQRLKQTEAPADYVYNTNLYRLAANRLAGADAGSSGFNLPVHVAVGKDGRMEILNGWELLDAARNAHAGQIAVTLYDTRDVVVQTPLTGFYSINYAGKDNVFVRDERTGKMRQHTPIDTGSYATVYTMPEMPDIPQMVEDGWMATEADMARILPWFERYAKDRAAKALVRAARKYGEGSSSAESLSTLMAEDPIDGRFTYYTDFFNTLAVDRTSLPAVLDAYAAYGLNAGQPREDFLTEKVMVDSLLNVYEKQFDRFYGRFVFTGGTATGMADVQQTPYANMYGINVIINAFNTIATDNQLTFTRDMGGLDFWLLLVVCMAAALVFGFADIRIGFVGFGVILAGIFLLGAALFISENIVLSTVPLAFGNIAVFAGVLIYKLLTEEKDKRFLKSTFSSYLSPELIEEMHKNRAHPTLGGEAKVITAFFTDIQGFSTFSEKLTAPQLVELLNEYLTAMTDILIREGGTLDKYEGDAIIAFFGAPVDLPDQELRACRTAVAMQRKLAELREKWKSEKVSSGEENRNQRNVPEEQWPKGDKWPAIVHNMRMRIGINTGDVVVGNMGSTMRMNYTMMGDSVNLAARLESAAKQYGIYTLVSEYTLDVEFLDEAGEVRRVMDLVEVRYLDRITVVGKAEPVRVYELIGMKGDITDEERKLIATFSRGMECYLQLDCDGAIDCFSESYSLERYPSEATSPSEVFIQRCRNFKENPPVAEGQAWDGVYQLTKK